MSKIEAFGDCWTNGWWVLHVNLLTINCNFGISLDLVFIIYISSTDWWLLILTIPDLRVNYNLMHNIEQLGKNLSSVNLLMKFKTNWMIKCIIEGCPKLKTLTLESVSDDISHYLIIDKWTLEDLQKDCKELKDLKLSKVWFWNIHSEDEIKKILPDCNVELVEAGWR